MNIDSLRKKILEVTNIPDFHFYCHPRSSVVDNLAKNGSDIDGGLIVTSSALTPNQQLVIVEYLRSQGFAVFSENEFIEAEKLENNFRNANSSTTELLKAIEYTVLRKQNMIIFRSQKEVEDELTSMKRNKTNIHLYPMWLKIYLGGHRLTPEKNLH